MYLAETLLLSARLLLGSIAARAPSHLRAVISPTNQIARVDEISQSASTTAQVATNQHLERSQPENIFHTAYLYGRLFKNVFCCCCCFLSIQTWQIEVNNHNNNNIKRVNDVFGRKEPPKQLLCCYVDSGSFWKCNGEMENHSFKRFNLSLVFWWLNHGWYTSSYRCWHKLDINIRVYYSESTSFIIQTFGVCCYR